MESDRDKFIRLAESRVNTVIKTLRLIGNLSNQGNYSYSIDDVDKIFNALEKELRNTRQRFNLGSKKENDLFSLK